MKKKLGLLTGTVAVFSILASGAFASESTEMKKEEINMSELRVDLLENALAPDSAIEAVQKWAEALSLRNGAYQYALFNEDMRVKADFYFQQNGWITGGSSPWIENYVIKGENQFGDFTYTYELEFHLATSTGKEGTEIVNVTIEKDKEHWFVANVNGDSDALVMQRTPYLEKFFTFRAEEYAFVIPLSWDMKYHVEEKEGNLVFQYKSENKHVSPEVLFSIEKMKEEVWDKDYEDSLYKKLGEKDGYIYALLPVSENPYSANPESKEYMEFEKMSLQRGIIKGTFQFIN